MLMHKRFRLFSTPATGPLGRFAPALLAVALGLAMARSPAAVRPRHLPALPREVAAALKAAQVPPTALSAVVVPVEGGRARLRYRGAVLRHPASVMKLFTTYAALDRLGPAFQWHTPVGLDGAVRDGVLHGSLYLQGRGDPSLVSERLWLLLTRVRDLGVRRIDGDIVIDHSAFQAPPQDPGEFDGEPLRPYNVAPDAFLVNFKSVLLRFTPLADGHTAQLAVEPALQGVTWPASVPMSDAPCNDWRHALDIDFSDVSHPRFRGALAAACGASEWPLAWPEPQAYDALAVEAQWRALGGSLQGQVRSGDWPEGLKPSFDFTSPPLTQVVYDINKYSNNLMARQLFLTLGLEVQGMGSLPAARAVVQAQAAERARCSADELVLDNGSGLSRSGATTADCLARLLVSAWHSAVMPELLASLPVAGVDGTDRHAQQAVASAHLKTGSLRDVAAVAGIVLADSGRRYVVVGLINDEHAQSAREALDALVGWAQHDRRR